MSLVYNIINEHVSLLKSKGYDEEGLSNPDKVDNLAKQLSRQVQDAINRNSPSDSTKAFTIKAFGFFNNNSEIALFKLKYSLDVKQALLSLSELKVIISDKKKVWLLKENKDLPSATEALKAIKEEVGVVKKHSKTPRIVDEKGKGLKR